MADNATISINDGQTVPVAHAFDPILIKDGAVATYQNRTALIVSGREQFRVGLKVGTSVRTVDLNLKVPRIISEVLNGVTVSRVADFATCKATIIVPTDWTVADCKNAQFLLGNACLHATIGKMVQDAEFVW